MAVILLDDWNGFTSGSPTGSASITAGSSRLMWLVYIVEDTSITFNSMTVGGVSATGSQLSNNSSATEQYLWSWYWDETAITAMTSTSIALSKNGPTTKRVWDYATWDGVTGGAEYATAVQTGGATNSSISTVNPSSTNDMLAVAINRSAANRDVTAYDTLTEGWQRNTDFTTCVADGVGGDDDTALTGDGFSGDWLIQQLHMKASTAALAILMKNLHEEMLNG